MSYFTAAEAAKKAKKRSNSTNFNSLRNKNILTNPTYSYKLNGYDGAAVSIEACGAKPFSFLIRKKKSTVCPKRKNVDFALAQIAFDLSSNLSRGPSNFSGDVLHLPH